MKHLMLILVTASVLFGLVVYTASAEEKIWGWRYVEDAPNKSQGETRRTEVFNAKNELVSVRIRYKNGNLRNESYEKGILKTAYETDFKGWFVGTLYENGSLASLRVQDNTGKSTVYISIDLVKSVNLSIGDELHLVSFYDPWPGHRYDKVTLKPNSTLLKSTATPANLPKQSKLLTDGSYSANAAGNVDMKVETTVTTPGFQGPFGRPPTRSTTTGTIKVLVR